VSQWTRDDRSSDLRWSAFEVAGGWIGAVTGPRGLRYLSLPRADRESAGREVTAGFPKAVEDDTAFDQLRADLAAYFAGRPVDLTRHPVDAEMTPFQRRVLEACARIPHGATKTYGELAAEVGSQGAARAVGQVMAQNPVALVFP
jgi:methylated-DNA-[protein]-cysteine S-methyltransferase